MTQVSVLVEQQAPPREIPASRFVKGTGKYVEDVSLPRMLYATVIRSPHARAKITSVDTRAAESYPGVVAVLTGSQTRNKTKPYSELFCNDLPPILKKTDRYCLASGKVNYVGEPVIAIAAESRAACKDAAELVSIDYQLLEPVAEMEAGVRPDSPKIYDELESNILFSHKIKGGDVKKAFDAADQVFSQVVKCQRYTASPIQPRGCVAEYDSGNEQLTLWAPAQSPHLDRTYIADALEMPESKVRIITSDIGGSFGIYQATYPELIIVSLLSKMTRRPVKWIEERSEHFQASCHARECTHYLEVAVRNDGIILGVKDRILYDLGYVYYPTPGVPSPLVTALYVPGPYRIRNYDADVLGVATNKTPLGPYRGFGKENATLAIERVMDNVARKLGIDPIKIRMMNFIAPEEFPYTSATGEVYDSGEYARCLTKLLEMVDYEKLKEEKKILANRGKHAGIGVVFMLEPAASRGNQDVLRNGYESATVRIEPMGTVTVLSGLTSQGQDHETIIPEVVSKELGVQPTDVKVIEGDTLLCPFGMGAWSSRSCVIGIPAIIQAVRQLKEKVMKIAAFTLGTRVEDLGFSNGSVISRSNPERSLPLAEIARLAYIRVDKLPKDLEAGLNATSYYFAPSMNLPPDELGRKSRYSTVSSGACLALVEVDAETGTIKVKRFAIVHDSGTIINERVVAGQLHGGVAQGIGGAIDEELPYDRNGQLLASSFMDYLLPVASEIPDIQVGHITNPSPFVLGGFKGAGEGGAIAVAPVLASAVEDALSSFGVSVTEMPLKPENVWRIVNSSRKRARG